MNEEEEELCDAMDACTMKDEVACAMEVAGAGDDDDDDDDDKIEPSYLYKSIWKEVLKLSPEELTHMRDKMSRRLCNIRENMRNRSAREQERKDALLSKANELLAEMTKWKGREKPHHSIRSDYYMWNKWNTNNNHVREKALKAIKDAGLLPPDDDAGAPVPAPVPAPAGAKVGKAGKGGKGAKGGKDGKDGAK
jgi:hypothetical protein